jgi:hypothetical protein
MGSFLRNSLAVVAIVIAQIPHRSWVPWLLDTFADAILYVCAVYLSAYSANSDFHNNRQ